ncbi:CBL-interacting serine/threonine-protein kinase 16 [Biomphalaria glabrata]|nr:CBL-interacting serine/threonine-protein kinase 16 [Biomphalaria glabrata]
MSLLSELNSISPLVKEYAKDVFQTFGLTKEELLEQTRCNIYLAHKNTDTSVKKVVKFYRRCKKSSQRFYNEVAIAKKLKHPNIIIFEEAASFPKHHALIMPYCELGALYNMIGKVPIHISEHYFLQTCSAVKYLHDNFIVHRDIKLDNILVDANQKVYLTDFDMSCTVSWESSIVHNAGGTTGYRAPEMVMSPKGSYDGYKLDVFALGVVLFCLIFEKDVEDLDETSMSYLDMVKTYIWTFPVHFYKNVLECMLEPDPKARWDMRGLIKGLGQASWLAARVSNL